MNKNPNYQNYFDESIRGFSIKNFREMDVSPKVI